MLTLWHHLVTSSTNQRTVHKLVRYPGDPPSHRHLAFEKALQKHFKESGVWGAWGTSFLTWLCSKLWCFSLFDLTVHRAHGLIFDNILRSASRSWWAYSQLIKIRLKMVLLFPESDWSNSSVSSCCRLEREVFAALAKSASLPKGCPYHRSKSSYVLLIVSQSTLQDKKYWFLLFANFHSVNIPNTADFKQQMWYQSALEIPETPTINSTTPMAKGIKGIWLVFVDFVLLSTCIFRLSQELKG